MRRLVSLCTWLAAASGLIPTGGPDDRTVLELSLHLADGTAHTIIPRGSKLPAQASALLSTGRHQQPSIQIRLLLGLRPSASANRAALGLLVPVTPADRGLVQLSVAVGANSSHVWCSAEERTGEGGTVRGSANKVVVPGPAVEAGSLPALWKYHNIYTDKPHPGYTIAGRFLRLQQQPLAAALPREYGEVAAHATGSIVWPAAYVLIRWLEAEFASSEATLSVLELGAGTGAAGLAMALMGHRVTLTDLEDNLPIVRRNAASNELEVTVQALDWTAPLPPQIRAVSWDLVVFADCVFWPHLFKPLVRTLAQLNSRRVVFSLTHRLGRSPAFLQELATSFEVQKLQPSFVYEETDVYSAYYERRVDL